MTLQEEMFALVNEWKSTGLSKKAFLQDKAIGLQKFTYWCEKHGRQPDSKDLSLLDQSGPFRELVIDDGLTDGASRLLELTTPSGMRITVFG